LVCDFAPAVFTDWQVFAFDLYVKFDVFTVALVFPRVSTMFNHIFHVLFLKMAMAPFLLLKGLFKLLTATGER
jgi:hypothetical protein